MDFHRIMKIRTMSKTNFQTSLSSRLNRESEIGRDGAVRHRGKTKSNESQGTGNRNDGVLVTSSHI